MGHSTDNPCMFRNNEHHVPGLAWTSSKPSYGISIVLQSCQLPAGNRWRDLGYAKKPFSRRKSGIGLVCGYHSTSTPPPPLFSPSPWIPLPRCQMSAMMHDLRYLYAHRIAAVCGRVNGRTEDENHAKKGKYGTTTSSWRAQVSYDGGNLDERRSDFSGVTYMMGKI